MHPGADQGGPSSDDERDTLVHPGRGGVAVPPADDLLPGEAATLIAEGSSGGEAPEAVEPALRTIARDGYEIEGHFAQGGIGRILRAHDRHLGRPVALKELLVAGRGDVERRFIREALLTARLQHPAIVPIYEAGRWPSGEPFYAMKLVAGRELFDVLAERSTLDERLALLPSVLTVAEAVAYAHDHGVIHRDLKPENVLVGDYGETVVIDWGLAKDLRAPDEIEPEEPAALGDSPASAPSASQLDHERHLTVAGAIMGTPSYMPPEQAEGRAVDTRADVYAIGAILYHLLTGEPPYDGPTAMAILTRVLTRPPTPLIERAPGVPRDLAAIVESAMARDPAARYPSARELADDLRRFLTGKLVAAHHYSRRERLRRWLRRNRAAVLVASVALLALALIGGASLRSVLQSEREARAAEAEARAAEAEATRRADQLALDQARHLARSQPNRAIELLAGLRDRSAWRRLRVLAADARTHGLAVVFRGHLRGSSRVVFSADGALVATTSDDCSVRLWDLAGGEHRVLIGHRDQTWRAAFSPDGRVLATTGRDASVRLWDPVTGAPGAVLSAAAPTRAVAFSADGAFLAFSTDDHALWSWTPATGEARRLTSCDASYLFHDGRTAGCVVDPQTVWIGGFDGAQARQIRRPDANFGSAGAFSPDGRIVAVGGVDGYITLFELPSGDSTRLYAGKERVRSVAFSPDGQLLAAGTRGDRTLLWRVADRQLLHELRGADVVIRLAFSPDSSLLAGIGADPSIHLWSVVDGVDRPLVGFTQSVLGLAFAPDGRRIAGVGIDGELRIWAADEVHHRRLGHGAAPRRPVAFTPDGAVLLSEPSGAILRWPLGSAAAPEPLGAHERALIGLAVDPADGRVLSLDQGGLLRAWHPDGRLLAERALAGDWPQSLHLVAFAGGRAVLALIDGVVVWEPVSGQMRHFVAPAGRLVRAVVTADGRYVATGHESGAVLRWQLATGESLEIHRFRTAVSALDLTADGQLTVSGGDDDSIHVRDLRGGDRSWTLAGDSLITRAVALDPAGRRLAFASRNNVIHLAELDTQRRLPSLRGHRADLQALIFFGEDHLLSRATDGEVRLWDLESGESRALPARGPQEHFLPAPDRRTLLTRGEGGEISLWRDDLPREPVAFQAWLDAAWRPVEGPPLPAEAVAACPGLQEHFDSATQLRSP